MSYKIEIANKVETRNHCYMKYDHGYEPGSP